MNRQRKCKILVFIICLVLLFGFYKFIARPKLKSIPLNKSSAEDLADNNDSVKSNNINNDLNQSLNNNEKVVIHSVVSDQDSSESPESEQITADAQESVSSTFPVHIMGAVNNPGVYMVNAGMIIQDAIELSGGLKADADLLLINLAEPLQANSKVYIPNTTEIEQDLIKYERILNSKTEFSDIKSTTEKPEKINLNTADFDLLLTLTGIGPVKAQAILDFREENGDFQMIEEIMSVPGIKEAGFDKIKDQIVVN